MATEPAAPSKRPRPCAAGRCSGVAVAVALVMKLMGSASPGTPASNPSSPARSPAQARPDAAGGKGGPIDPARLDVHLEALEAERPAAAESGTESLPLQAGAAPAGTAAGREQAGSDRAARAGGPAATATAPTDHGEVHRHARPGGWQADRGRSRDCSAGRRQSQAREGGTVDGRYRLVRIGRESVVIEHLDGRGRTTLAAGGQDCVEIGAGVTKQRLVFGVDSRGSDGRCPGAPPGGRSARARKPRGSATGTRRSPTTRGRCRRTPTIPSSRLRSSARCRAPRRSTSAAPASSKRRISSTPRCSSTEGDRDGRDQPAGRRARRGARADHPRSDRGDAARARRSRRCASRRGRGRRRCSVCASALRVNFDNSSLRDILNFIGSSAGINVTYDQAVPGQGLHRRARRRDARGGAAADHVGQPALLQGPQPEDDHRRRRSRRQARSSTTSWWCGCSTCRTPTRRSCRRCQRRDAHAADAGRSR